MAATATRAVTQKVGRTRVLGGQQQTTRQRFPSNVDGESPRTRCVRHTIGRDRSDEQGTSTLEKGHAGRVELSFDLYRDVHKGIRAELFAVTHEAGRLDPACDADRADLARHVRSVVDLLVTHAEHEDAHIQPIVERELPDVAERIASDHEAFDRRILELAGLAEVASGERFDSHEVYLELASFTSLYLAHQDFEERIVMPSLDSLLGLDGLLPVHGAIIASIPPDVMASALASMLPAMNVDDRTELLGGMNATAPAEVFAGVWSLAGSVLTTGERDAVARRLGL